MICPLLMSAVIIAKANALFTGDVADVAKGLTACGDWCAWWDKEQDCCVICTIAGELDALHYFTKSIRDRMPKDLAPR